MNKQLLLALVESPTLCSVAGRSGAGGTTYTESYITGGNAPTIQLALEFLEVHERS